MSEPVGKYEKRGKHEAGLPWCLSHDRASPTSNTYCHISHVMAHWKPENQCRVRGATT